VEAWKTHMRIKINSEEKARAILGKA